MLVYPRGQIPVDLSDKSANDTESQATRVSAQDIEQSTDNNGADASIIQRQTAIFSWKDVVYDIKIKGEPRRILDHVDGWVKPGTLTALMVSGTW